MYRSGLAAPVLPAAAGLTAEQLKAAAVRGYANPCVNAEAEYLAQIQAQKLAVVAVPLEQKPS